MKHFLLFYELATDYLERRGSFRAAHLQLAWAACERGQLMLGGAVNDPTDLALLLFKSDTPEAAESFARADPYVKNGLVRSWRVREWTTVIGQGAASPVRPSGL